MEVKHVIANLEKREFLKTFFLPKSKLLFTFGRDLLKFQFMKCSELLRLLKNDGWYPASQKGSHVKLKNDKKEGTIIFPNHGSQEIGKGLEKKILKDAGIKL